MWCKTLHRQRLGLAMVYALCPFSVTMVSGAPVKALFLGDKGHHNPVALHNVVAPVFTNQGVQCDYTESTANLALSLVGYDALLLYNNLDALTGKPIADIQAFVRSGKGLVVVHCGIVMAGQDLRFDSLVGGRFVRHDTAVFRAQIVDSAHAAMRGVETFQSWDETYEHRLGPTSRTLLMVRPKSGAPEPWTWVRTEGRGRVYYTASGHDNRTWIQPAFQKQLVIAIKWAATLDAVFLRPGVRQAQGNSPLSGVYLTWPARGEWVWKVAKPGIIWVDAEGRVRGN